MRMIMVVSLVLLLFMTSGCASIISGSKDTISVTSNPSEANFRILDNTGRAIHSGTTPSVVSLKRGDGYFKKGDYTVEFTKNNGKKATLPIEQNVNGLWYIGGNLFFGGFVGWLVVDPLTGAMYTIEDVHMELGEEVSAKNIKIIKLD